MPASSDQRILALLAPGFEAVPPVFRQPQIGTETHAKYLAKLQQLRGRVYVDDGAIDEFELREDGRHCVPADEMSWHVVALDGKTVTGCARLQVVSPAAGFAELGVARCAQARCPTWGDRLRRCVRFELERAQRDCLGFVEAGGWAIAPALRSTTEALRIALGSFALGELLGGCLGLSTATVRHNSSTILRRLGASSLFWDGQALPPYYDPMYRCEMEVVTFDSRRPNPKFAGMMEQLKHDLMLAPVYCAAGQSSEIPAVIPALSRTASLPSHAS